MISSTSAINFDALLRDKKPADARSEICRNYREPHKQLTSLERKFEKMKTRTVVKTITDKLHEADLSKILDDRCSFRKWIVLTYNTLREHNQLHFKILEVKW